MALDLSPESLARGSAKRPWTTIGIWVGVLILAMATIVVFIGDALTTDIGPIRSVESDEAYDLIGRRFFVPGREATEVVLVRSTDRTLEDPEYRTFVEGLYSDIKALGPEIVLGGTHYYLSGDESLVSLDRHTTAIVITLATSNENWDRYWGVFKARDEDQWQRPENSDRSGADRDGFQVYTTAVGAGGEVITIRSSHLTVDDDEYRRFVEDLFYEILALGRPNIWGGSYYYPFRDESMVSEDRQATIIPLGINNWDRIDRVHAVTRDADRDERFEVHVTGEATLDKDFNDVSERDLRVGELMFGLPMAIIVLILVFGALAAASIPIIVALVSIIVALGLSMLFAQFMTISIFLTNMVFMMGLAVGIDYCLFIVARFREELSLGRERHDAIARAGATANQAVLFSGLTVVLALTGLMLIRHDIFVSLGLGAVLVVLVAIAASLTLLPAVLALMGDRVNSLRLPIVYGLQARSEEQAAGGAWDRIARAVMRAPVPSVLLSGGLLVAAAVPLIYLSVGSAGVTALPDSFESKKGFEALARDFPAGLTEPVIVAIDGAVDAAEVQDAIERLRTTLEQDGDFGAVSEDVNPKRDLTRLTVPLAKGDPNGEAAMSAVNRLRDEYIPDAFAGVPAMALVTGQTAEVVDHVDIGKDGLKLLIPFILVLSFVLLTLVFRSLVVPVKAAIMNLLSVGAAYGLLVLVFQKGVGSDFLGFQQVETIEWWVPPFLFAVLFGLSMDYHVFLLSRIRERFQETDDNTGSVAYGIRSTGRLITGAALIMLAVFVGFAAGDLPMFQQMGFGLAVAVVLDATIVRSVLVPASMRLLGRANWYWPSWLDWVPTFRVERPPEPDPTDGG